MRRSLVSLAFAGSLTCSSAVVAGGGAIPAPPPPGITLPPAVDSSPVATITFANSTALRVHSAGRHLPTAAILPHEIVTIRLQYSADLAGVPIIASALDGGKAKVRGGDAISATGIAWVQFKAGEKPGRYRVHVVAGNTESIVNFWIIDPDHPKGTPPLLSPEASA